MARHHGFEYDWSGVSIGPDLVFRDGHLVIDRSASRDPVLQKKPTEEEEEAEVLIGNTYKALMTCVRGTLLFSTDAETQEFLKGLIGPSRGSVVPTRGAISWRCSGPVGPERPRGSARSAAHVTQADTPPIAEVGPVRVGLLISQTGLDLAVEGGGYRVPGGSGVRSPLST